MNSAVLDINFDAIYHVISEVSLWLVTRTNS